MQQRTGFALRSAVAALAVAATAIALTGASEAAPAEACLAAPKGVAPQGRHWYYRLERPSMRKCWYLAEKGRKVAPRAATAQAPQAEPDEEADEPATVASVPAAPVVNAPAAPLANVAPAAVTSVPDAPAEQPKPVITTLTTRNVSNEIQSTATESMQPPLVTNSASSTAPVAEAAPAEAVSKVAERFPSDQPASAAVAEQPPAPAATPEPASASSATMTTLQLLLGAIALTAFVACGVFFAMALLRRRKDVLNTRHDTDTLPYEQAPEMAAEEEGPRFEPLRALDPMRQRDLDPMRQHDDVDEILQRLARRRRAA